MPVSINALFGIPTREEKFKTRQQETENTQLQQRMRLADELTRGQMQYARQLGLDFGEKEAEQLHNRNIRMLKQSGVPNPEQVAAQGAAAPVAEAAGRGVTSMLGLELGTPMEAAAANRAALLNQRTAEEAKAPYVTLLTQATAATELGKQQLQGYLDQADINMLPLRNTATAAKLTAERDAARAASTRQQGVQGFLSQIANQPLYQAIVAGGIDPRYYGFGVTNPYGPTPAMPLPDGSQPPQSQTQGMLGRPKMTAEEALMKALEGRDIKIAQ